MVFSHIVKIRRTIVRETDTASKKNLKVSQNDQRIIFSLNKTDLKLISRQQKKDVFTCCFNNTFLLKTPMKLYFMFPLGVPPHPNFINFHQNSPVIEYVQHYENTCVFSSLASDLYYTIEHVS